MAANKSTRDYVMMILERVDNLKEDFESHKKSHRWLVGLIIGVPSFILTIIMLVQAVKALI